MKGGCPRGAGSGQRSNVPARSAPLQMCPLGRRGEPARVLAAPIRAQFGSTTLVFFIGDRATERGCGRVADATGRDGGASVTDASAGDWVCRQTWRQTQSPAGAGVEIAPPSLNVGGGTPPYPLGVAVCPLTFVPFRAEGGASTGAGGAQRAHKGSTPLVI